MEIEKIVEMHKQPNPQAQYMHPYYPIGINIPGYETNKDALHTVVVYFSLGLTAILGTVFGIAIYVRPSLSKADKLAILWFTLSGSLHCLFEGYFITHHSRMGPAQDLFGQLWKEYAKSDSRYLISDPFVVSVETITVTVWGPLCLTVAYLTAHQHPLQHPLRIVVCVAHLYGDILYYATSLFDHYVNGVSYSRPEALYFWVYYFLMNFVWIVVPACLLYASVVTTSNAVRALDGADDKSKHD